MKEFWGKVSKILLFCLVLLMPTQLGKHFWFDWSTVLGLRIDYFSPTIYLMDIFFLGFVVADWLMGNKKNKRMSFSWILVLMFILINILIAQNKWVAVYKWLRLVELGYFCFWILKNKKTARNILIRVIPWWIMVESILALGQITKGGSLNGWWWFLGERRFDFNTIGIAQMSIADMGLVRAYGTFSHPNSLAGFLLVGLMWWVKAKPSLNSSFDRVELNLRKILWWIVFWVGLVGIFLAGSRTIWGLTGGFLIFWWWNLNISRREKIKGLVFLGIIIGCLLMVVNYNYPLKNFLGGWDENGIIKRGQLNSAAIGMIKQSPWVGVGLGNYLVELPNFQKNNHIFWFQPVHNIFLLLVSEIGILGLIGLVWLCLSMKNWEKIDKWGWAILGVIFISGMIDHYWFTLPQNMWLLVLMLGVI